MKRIRRPSAPVIVAIIAIVVALAGTAVAGGGFITKKKFNKFKATAITAPVSYVVVDKSIPANTYTNVAPATCPAGTRVVDGGIKIPNPSSGTTGPAAPIYDGYPTATGYAGHVRNLNAAAVTATTIAICAIVPSSAGTPPAS
jgi:hypothetical protein